eukprot:gene14858-biopygen1080
MAIGDTVYGEEQLGTPEIRLEAGMNSDVLPDCLLGTSADRSGNRSTHPSNCHRGGRTIISHVKDAFSTKRFGGTVGGNCATGGTARPIWRHGGTAAQLGGTASQPGGTAARRHGVAARRHDLAAVWRHGGTAWRHLCHWRHSLAATVPLAAQLGGNCATGGTAALTGGTGQESGSVYYQVHHQVFPRFALFDFLDLFNFPGLPPVIP